MYYSFIFYESGVCVSGYLIHVLLMTEASLQRVEGMVMSSSGKVVVKCFMVA